MIGYIKCFENNDKTISFRSVIKNECIKCVYQNNCNLARKEFDSEPVYGNKYIKTKRRIYGDKVNTNFQCEKVPKKYIM